MENYNVCFRDERLVPKNGINASLNVGPSQSLLSVAGITNRMNICMNQELILELMKKNYTSVIGATSKRIHLNNSMFRGSEREHILKSEMGIISSNNE